MSGLPPPPDPRPGCHDKAWNDPPLFSYSTCESAPNPKAKLKNRVGFPPPFAAVPSAAAVTNPSNALPLSVKPPPRPDLEPPPLAASSSTSSLQRSRAATLKDIPDPTEVVEMLQRVIAEYEARIGRKKADDVRKRVEAMRLKWDSSLNIHVRSGMRVLAEGLIAKDFEKCEKIQKALTVDWPSLCGTWMVGIKHLIQEARKAQDADSVMTGTTSRPVLLPYRLSTEPQHGDAQNPKASKVTVPIPIPK